MREGASGRLVALLRGEVFCTNPLELRGRELEHVVMFFFAFQAIYSPKVAYSKLLVSFRGTRFPSFLGEELASGAI